MATSSSDENNSCCAPHVFTSVLLGVLACVLMTGGVFLAFHRWDPLWLVVSGVGIVLLFMGSVLHCCNNRHQESKGCCRVNNLHNHVVFNNGSLTEQLLPISNARSVSQLSLNMLPGYFPPVVATYGIEQHSALIQHINRIIQQQNVSQTGSNQSGYILLSLPGNTSHANIQNLMATVYQMEGSILEASSTMDAAVNPPPEQNNFLKNAEVQTSTTWPEQSSSVLCDHAATSTNNVTTGSPNTIQIEADPPVNLMDCSPDASTTVDTLPDSITLQESSTQIPSSTVLVDLSANIPPVIPDNPHNSNSLSSDISSIEILVDLPSELLTIVNAAITPLLDSRSDPFSNTVTEIPNSSSHSAILSNDISADYVTEVSNSDNATHVLNQCTQDHTAVCNSDELEIPDSCSETASINCELSALESENNNNMELSASENEDCESLSRSSPPPSYEDVADRNRVGLAYGTL